MNINIVAHKIELTDAIKQDIESKLKPLDDLMSPNETVYVEVGIDAHHKSGNVQRAEVHIKPTGYYAEAVAEDLYSAIDMVVPKIREQIIRKKDKRISLRRKLGSLFKRNR